MPGAQPSPDPRRSAPRQLSAYRLHQQSPAAPAPGKGHGKGTAVGSQRCSGSGCPRGCICPGGVQRVSRAPGAPCGTAPGQTAEPAAQGTGGAAGLFAHRTGHGRVRGGLTAPCVGWSRATSTRAAPGGNTGRQWKKWLRGGFQAFSTRFLTQTEKGERRGGSEAGRLPEAMSYKRAVTGTAPSHRGGRHPAGDRHGPRRHTLAPHAPGPADGRATRAKAGRSRKRARCRLPPRRPMNGLHSRPTILIVPRVRPRNGREPTGSPPGRPAACTRRPVCTCARGVPSTGGALPPAGTQPCGDRGSSPRRAALLGRAGRNPGRAGTTPSGIRQDKGRGGWSKGRH